MELKAIAKANDMVYGEFVLSHRQGQQWSSRPSPGPTTWCMVSVLCHIAWPAYDVVYGELVVSHHQGQRHGVWLACCVTSPRATTWCMVSVLCHITKGNDVQGVCVLLLAGCVCYYWQGVCVVIGRVGVLLLAGCVCVVTDRVCVLLFAGCVCCY